MPNYNTTLQTNNSSLEEIITQLNNLPNVGNGLDTSDATATSGDILEGKTAYVDGEKVTGTIVTKTVNNLTANGATVTVPVGYYSAQATKTVATATQATPVVSINSSTGKITATATQTAGYVTAGSKSGTLQLAFQAAQTITPGTTNKTIAANTYLGGVQTIKGDANLVASNIVSGKSIFGVVGTATTGSGGDTSAEDSLITGTATTYTNGRVTSIRDYAFYNCTNLTSVNFPACKGIDTYAFAGCIRLESVNFPVCMTVGSSAFGNCALVSVSFPACTSIGRSAFYNCDTLISINFPACRSIGSSAFYNCSSLTSVSFPVCTNIISHAFYNCSSLTSASFPQCLSIGFVAFMNCIKFASIYLGASKVCSLNGSTVFSGTSITSTTGSIFVPASLVASYKAATNWAYFSNRIFSYNFT